MTAGRSGQYEVSVDGEVIASREQGILKRLFLGGWPDNEVILSEIQRRRTEHRTNQRAE